MYLTAVIDWHSRFIVGYELSDTLDTAPVLSTIKQAIATYGAPAIINSDYAEENTMPKFFFKLCTEPMVHIFSA